MLDLIALIGRFQIFSEAHRELLNIALTKAHHVVVVLGSDGIARNPRNPFTAAERAVMIASCYDAETNKRIHYLPQRDHPYNLSKWYTSVRSGVQAVATTIYGFRDRPTDLKIGIIGHLKDKTSFYVKGFHDWELVEVENIKGINATDLRKKFFERGGPVWPSSLVCDSVTDHLVEFTKTDHYTFLVEEYNHYKEYKEKWSTAPYPPIFNTVDAVIVQNGCVLLIRRKHNPGKGLLALPGGFIEQTQTIEEALLAEIRQETAIAVSNERLLGSVEWSKRFDDVYRSLRGRTITEAFLIRLRDGEALPYVKGGDDASHAQWVRIEDIKMDQMFEDHGYIIETMLGI